MSVMSVRKYKASNSDKGYLARNLRAARRERLATRTRTQEPETRKRVRGPKSKSTRVQGYGQDMVEGTGDILSHPGKTSAGCPGGHSPGICGCDKESQTACVSESQSP